MQRGRTAHNKKFLKPCISK